MKKTILILHGWGLSGEKYVDLQKILEKNGYKVLAPDLPGFGTEPLVKSDMTLDDYSKFLYQFYKKNKITTAYIIAHSFGGRVTAKFAMQHSELIEKIVFTGSPLIRQKLGIKKQLVSTTAYMSKWLMERLPKKLQKKIRWVVYRSIGEWDYYKADEMKETFKNVINEDTAAYLPKIKNPVLNLWGKHDKMVPEYVGRQITAAIAHAQFGYIEDGGHAIPYSHPREFSRQVLSFLGK